MSEAPTDWEEVTPDPDPEQDLEYAGQEWDVIPVEQPSGDHLVFLPSDDDAVWRDEFVIAEQSAVCTLYEMR